MWLFINPGTGLILVEKVVPRRHVHIEKREPFCFKRTVLFFCAIMQKSFSENLLK